MPITSARSVESVYVLANVACDMIGKRIVANLQATQDGQDAGSVGVVLEGDDFLAILGGIPAAGMTRGNDIADIVYRYAVSKGIVQGTIT